MLNTCHRCSNEFVPEKRHPRQMYCGRGDDKNSCSYKAAKDKNKIWALNNKDKTRAGWDRYKERHPERILESRVKCRRHVRAYHKKWYEDNKERRLLQIKAWKVANPEKHKSIHAKDSRLRYFRMRGAVGSHTWFEWKSILKTFNYTCPMCFRSEPEVKLTVDHKIPIVKGGTNAIDNLQPLCHSCNSSKHAKIWFASCPYVYPHKVQCKLKGSQSVGGGNCKPLT